MTVTVMATMLPVQETPERKGFRVQLPHEPPLHGKHPTPQLLPAISDGGNVPSLLPKGDAGPPLYLGNDPFAISAEQVCVG